MSGKRQKAVSGGSDLPTPPVLHTLNVIADRSPAGRSGSSRVCFASATSRRRFLIDSRSQRRRRPHTVLRVTRGPLSWRHDAWAGEARLGRAWRGRRNRARRAAPRRTEKTLVREDEGLDPTALALVGRVRGTARVSSGWWLSRAPARGDSARACGRRARRGRRSLCPASPRSMARGRLRTRSRSSRS
jgi:hypothetical protein